MLLGGRGGLGRDGLAGLTFNLRFFGHWSPLLADLQKRAAGPAKPRRSNEVTR
jgi:hypothetical protein